MYPHEKIEQQLLTCYHCGNWCKLLNPSMFRRKTKELRTVSGLSDAAIDRTGKLMRSLGLFSE